MKRLRRLPWYVLPGVLTILAVVVQAATSGLLSLQDALAAALTAAPATAARIWVSYQSFGLHRRRKRDWKFAAIVVVIAGQIALPAFPGIQGNLLMASQTVLGALALFLAGSELQGHAKRERVRIASEKLLPPNPNLSRPNPTDGAGRIEGTKP